MSNTNPTDQRAQDIAVARAALDLAERIPDLPLPFIGEVYKSLIGHSDESANELLDRAEAALTAAGLPFTARSDDHDRTLIIPIGDRSYRIAKVWDRVMERFLARRSYTDNVQVDEPAEAAR